MNSLDIYIKAKEELIQSFFIDSKEDQLDYTIYHIDADTQYKWRINDSHITCMGGGTIFTHLVLDMKKNDGLYMFLLSNESTSETYVQFLKEENRLT